MADHKAEDERKLIQEMAQHLRSRERYWANRFPFDLKFNYWDADELNVLLLKEDKDYLIKREEGLSIVVTAKAQKHPEYLTLRADQLIEIMHADPASLNAILMTMKEFGKVDIFSMSSPGLSEMGKYCKKIDGGIVESLKKLKKDGIAKGASKLWAEMGGDTCPPTDKLAKRLRYIMELLNLWARDKQKWSEPVRRLGLT